MPSNARPGPIFNSYFLATVSTLASVLIGVPTGYILTRRKSIYSNMLDIIIMLPFVIAGTILGIALITFFNQGWIVLTGTWIILALSYVIRKMPFIARSSASILYQLDPSLDEASISLGVSPMKTFYKVTFRLMMAGIVSGAILSWVTIISELSSTIVLQIARLVHDDRRNVSRDHQRRSGQGRGFFLDHDRLDGHSPAPRDQVLQQGQGRGFLAIEERMIAQAA